MVEADSHLKLLPTFILDIYKVFEHIDMCVNPTFSTRSLSPPSAYRVLGAVFSGH